MAIKRNSLDTEVKLLDTEMYDRQIRTFGYEASKKINNSSACIIGLEGCNGTEIAKNLALSGIKVLYLYDSNDNNLITNSDIEKNYYFDISNLNQSRSSTLLNKICELNPYIQVNILSSDEELINLPNLDVLIIVNQSFDIITKYNKLARLKQTKFISLCSSNFEGHIFVDAGDKHVISEISSENYEPVQIIDITKEGIVTTNGHEFQTDCSVEIYNVEGTNINFLSKLWKIEVISRYKFKLVDFSNVSSNNINFVFINGTVKHISISITINNKIVSNFNDNILEKYNCNNKINKNNENIAVVSIMGGIVASETLKLISNKYLPINQFLSWSDENITNEQYNLIKDKLNQTSWLLVGCGAIGCELLKNLSYLNIGNIKVTDPDVIEKSNLSRQFLFHSNDIGKLKSEVATNKIKQMTLNKKLNIEYYSEKVGFDNKSFTDNILKDQKITGVFNALDNISARKFMDEQCFNYNKPLFESGTLGTKGNTQPVIPFLTETYSNSNDPVIEKSFAVCTIKNFPNEIHHTIHWAMDQFELFNRGPNNLNLWLKNKEIIFSKTSIEDTQKYNDVYLFSTKYNVHSWIDCVPWAMDMFYDNFNHQIKQLLHNFPKDTLTTEGTLFWAGGKRCPSYLNFDINNNIHIDYIDSTIKLLCDSLSINVNYSIENLKTYIIQYKEIEFNPDGNKKIAKDDSELNKDNNSELNLSNDNLKLNKSYSISSLIKSQIFEKDNDLNNHIRWINASSNLRALNYGIPIVDFYTTKGIAGKIIPAISTTTSVIGGFIILEMIKYMIYGNEKQNLEKYKSTFINLADNLIISADPICASNKKVGNLEFNIWEKFNHNGDCLLNEFKAKYEELFKSPITMIAYNNSLLYADFIGDDNLNKNISNIIKELDNDTNISNQIELTILCEDETLELPQIIVKL